MSPGGIASAAKEIQTEAEKEVAARIALAQANTGDFVTWLQKNGLKAKPPTPKITGVSGWGPSISTTANTIVLGPPNEDYRVPGLYIYIIAEYQKYLPTGPAGSSTFVWITLDYMASRFAKIDFPQASSPCRNAEKTSDPRPDVCQFFIELAKKCGDSAVEAGVINMFNEWNSDSNLQSSLKSMEKGLVRAGVDTNTFSSVIEKFRSQAVSLRLER